MILECQAEVNLTKAFVLRAPDARARERSKRRRRHQGRRYVVARPVGRGTGDRCSNATGGKGLLPGQVLLLQHGGPSQVRA
jgi:hypothetical protein